jgi:MFS family permease
MSKKINLKEMEMTSWRYSMQDGLAEIFLGILLVVAGVLLSRDLPFGFFPLLFIILVKPLNDRIKKKFTYPRIGKVKLHEDEPKKTVVGIFLYMFVVAAIMAVAMFVIFREITSNLIYRSSPIFFALMLLGAMAYSHGKSGSKRFYVYAAIALVSAPIFSIVDFESKLAGLGYYLLFTGSIFTVIGLAIFVRFLQKYPTLR